MALCAFSLCSIATYAQQDRNVVFHMSDKTTKTVSLAGVDSLTFEKAVNSAQSRPRYPFHLRQDDYDMQRSQHALLRVLP